MISKNYNIMCEDCTVTEQLFSGTLAECKKEAKNMGWKETKGVWICPDCLEKDE